MQRRGVVLLLVIIFLTLFAALAISFVFYADAAAIHAELASQSASAADADVDPELLLGYFLNQLLYDARDDELGVYSALRGHSLMRTQWGADYSFNPDRTIDVQNTTVAFAGTGRLHMTYPDSAPPALALQDDFQLVNYTYFPADNFLRDPERLGYRAGLAAPRGAYTGSAHPSYTYADLNSLFLAAVQADGTLLVPSFHRPWLFGLLDASNPNWTSAEGKYKILRPRPAEHPATNGKPGFPYPEDATGDVKNLAIGSGGNDSLWLDLNFPVLTSRDGRKFKPLFAPLILDLDGKVNLNVHGNIRGDGGTHVSNQGWGPWEVSLRRVLAADAEEWKNLLRGSAQAPALGRYGPDGQPSPGPPSIATFGPTPPLYAQVDFDGCQAGGAPSGLLTLPTGTNAFPTFPAGYDNASAAECTNHPAIYRVLGAPGRDNAGYDRRFSLANLEAILRHRDMSSLGLASDPFTLCPKNLTDGRTRMLVTTDSADLNRPGLVPWMRSLTPYALTSRSQQYPRVPEKLLGGGAMAFPSVPSSPAPFDDFTQRGRAGDAPLTRVDLNRALPAYPSADPMTGKITDFVGFMAAQQARQALARDILLRLVKAVGAYDLTAYGVSAAWAVHVPPGPPEIDTLRWLAQLAVNVVDHIDSDDIVTPFPWAQLAGSSAFAALYSDQWVYGTELPRVLLNEAYAEYVNIPAEAGPDKRATRYVVHVWLELYNPLQSDPALSSNGDAPLDGSYQIVLTRANRDLLSPSDSANVLGDPDRTGAKQRYDFGQVYTASSDFTPAVLPTCDKAGGGFYVVGPADPVDGASPWDPGAAFGSMRKASMSYIEKVAPGQVIPPPNPTVLLRRLACPSLPYQPDPALDPLTLPYNPWVTIDFVPSLPLARAITNDGAGFPNTPTPLAKRTAMGRVQPYDGNPVTLMPQAPDPALTGQPQHTFYAHNQDAVFDPRPAFDWLIHPDRPLISPMELIHVGCCKPHQLTALFKNQTYSGYQTFNHAPYWVLSDPASPLYRAFELLATGCRAGGAAGADCTPGKININTIFDPEVFLALCDPQSSNGFSDADVQQIYTWMLASRTPGGTPGPTDRPFRSLGSACFTSSGNLYADAGGIDDTILRGNPSHPLYDAAQRPIRLFEIVKQPLAGSAIQDHPVQRYELMTKIHNQLTTRSNLFAVWLTVGFFEVNDDTTRPVQLGAELNRDTGRHIRHRMFAVVDRSQLIALFGGSGQAPITSTTAVPAAGPATIVPSSMQSPAPVLGNYTWSIRPGMLLRVTGPDATGQVNTEDIVVSAATTSTFTATFFRAYPSGFTSIAAYGNPGPRLGSMNPAREPTVVPYFSVIR
jgi:hypothetical protein